MDTDALTWGMRLLWGFSFRQWRCCAICSSFFSLLSWRCLWWNKTLNSVYFYLEDARYSFERNSALVFLEPDLEELSILCDKSSQVVLFEYSRFLLSVSDYSAVSIKNINLKKKIRNMVKYCLKVDWCNMVIEKGKHRCS